ncbi:sensor histidine kinase [Aminipila sp.]|uniref:sensor histidine kinase n=1 Tax=Aminipila sp. TaxID=2060095 RepID=UPI00289F034C|nr:HAMP domain-containing sensor histidine kinase [Aminipila sp.]
MKKSGYRSIFHIYLIFFFLLIGMVLFVIGTVFFTITIQKPNGQLGRSDWPKNFTEEFSAQIIFVDGKPQVKQAGLAQLQESNLWLQIIDENGNAVFTYNTPQGVPSHYTYAELLGFYETGSVGNQSIFTESARNDGRSWVYVVGFPLDISKVTMYLDGNKFSTGKPIFLSLIAAMVLVVVLSGLGYGYWMTKNMSRLTIAVKDVANRAYLPIIDQGSFADVYISLNTLDTEIKASDIAREQNDKMREEWIANVTHDLKTPLSPIRGYAELMVDPQYPITSDEIVKYAQTILKNTVYAQILIDDLKLTYQLQNEMFPIHKEQGNLTRFIKETVIDVLNHPDYATRNIYFSSCADSTWFDFDPKLLKRAFNNLLINALVHNSEETKLFVSIKSTGNIQICISDDGKGMNGDELHNLFSRYYRGTNTGEKAEGTGLGLAIAKQIIELHGGTISVDSKLNFGTSFYITFAK